VVPCNIYNAAGGSSTGTVEHTGSTLDAEKRRGLFFKLNQRRGQKKKIWCKVHWLCVYVLGK